MRRKKVKKIILILTLLVVVMTTSAVCISCKKQEQTADEVRISKTSMALEVGSEGTLTATTTNGQTIVWTSKDVSIATVTEQGVVTAIKVGKTEIVATAGDVNATCVLTVKEPETKEGLMIKLDKFKHTLNVKTNNKAVLIPTVTVDGVETEGIAVTWISSDETVAIVSDGNVTAKKIGVCDIICRVEKDGEWAEAKCALTVLGEVELDFKANGTDLILGEEFTLTPLVKVDGEPSTEKVEWSVSNRNVLKENGDGKFMPLSVGEATIYATVGGEEFGLEVKVFRKTLVSSAEDFKKLEGAGAYDYFLLTSDVYFDDSNVQWNYGEITRSGALNGVVSVNTIINTFGGTLDGNGHKVSMSIESIPIGLGGIFGLISDTANVKNTHFDTEITVPNEIDYRWSHTLCYQLNGKISDCYIKSTIDGLGGLNIAFRGAPIMQIKGVMQNNVIEIPSGYAIGYADVDKALFNNNFVITPDYLHVTSGYANWGGSTKLKTSNVCSFATVESMLNGVGATVTYQDTENGVGKYEYEQFTDRTKLQALGSAWTMDEDLLTLKGKALYPELALSFKGGNAEWQQLDGVTSTKISIDGTEITGITVTGGKFALAEYLVNGHYDLSKAHTVEVEVIANGNTYSDRTSARVTAISNAEQFKAIDGAGASNCFVLTTNVSITDSNTTALIDSFGATLIGNGYKISLTNTATRTAVTTGNAYGYSVMFNTVTNTAIIKNTQIVIIYEAAQTGVDGVATSRTAALAKDFNGLLENCYVKTIRSGTYQQSSLIYNLGGTLKNNVFEINTKHICAWETANTENRVSGALIVGSEFERVGKISGAYHNIENVSKYTSISNMLVGTGHTITSDGSAVTNTSITATPKYTGVFDSSVWNFNATAGTITLCGKTVG